MQIGIAGAYTGAGEEVKVVDTLAIISVGDTGSFQISREIFVLPILSSFHTRQFYRQIQTAWDTGKHRVW